MCLTRESATHQQLLTEKQYCKFASFHRSTQIVRRMINACLFVLIFSLLPPSGSCCISDNVMREGEKAPANGALISSYAECLILVCSDLGRTAQNSSSAKSFCKNNCVCIFKQKGPLLLTHCQFHSACSENQSTGTDSETRIS